MLTTLIKLSTLIERSSVRQTLFLREERRVGAGVVKKSHDREGERESMPLYERERERVRGR